MKLIDAEAETWVLGSLLLNPNLMQRVSSQLKPDDFASRIGHHLYESMLTLAAQKVPWWDLGPLLRDFRSRGNPNEYSAKDLAAIGDVPTAEHIDYYMQMVLEASVGRLLDSLSDKTKNNAPSDTITEVRTLINDCERRLTQLCAIRAEVTESTLRQAGVDALRERESGERQNGCPAITRGLESALGGPFLPGNVVIVGARPSTGKTLFLLQQLYVAAEEGKVSTLISQEMSYDQIGRRVLAHVGSLIPFTDDWRQLTKERVNEFFQAKTPIRFRRTGSGVLEVAAAIEQEHRSIGSTVFAVDYLQLIRGRGNSRYEQITDASNILKEVAIKTDSVIFLASQLSRATEQRSGAVPRMSELRDSGAIEQDADYILLLYWPSMDATKAKSENVSEDKYEVIVAKNRHGPRPANAVQMRIIPREQRLEDLPQYDFGPSVSQTFD